MVRPKLPIRPTPSAAAGTQNANAWIGGGLVVAVLIGLSAIGRCSSPSVQDNTPASLANNNMSNAIAAQSPPPPEPLDAAGVSRGVAHLRLAVSAEGFSGAMIYSQNCYDALTHRFTWAKLDTCGGFDMLAVRSIANADTDNLTSEAGYFQSEAAAGRYLAAATAAGEPATEADTRLSQLQSRVRRAATAGRRPAPAPEANTSAGVDNTMPPLDNGLDDDALDD